MKSIPQTKRSVIAIGALFVLTLMFGACVDDPESAENNNPSFWSPMIKIEKGDQKATLFLIDPRPFTDYAAPGPSNPEYFNIWFSEDGENFSLLKKASVTTTRVDITDLANGKSYYLYVSSHKKDKSMESGTVMTIPSAEPEAELYLPGMDFRFERLAASYDLNYISYISNSNLYLRSGTSGTPIALGYNTYSPTWSKIMNKLAYIGTKQEGITTYPYQLVQFEPESQTSTTLFQVQYHDYYVANPTFSPDGKKIGFLSSQNNAQKYIYDIWTVDPVSLERTQLTDFEAAGFYTDGEYDWSMTGEEIYLDGKFDLYMPTDIYKVSLATKTLTPVIQSPWRETSPVLSPDNTRLAFISNRTGENELWTYDLVQEKYAQITGESTYHFDSRYTNLQWLANDQMLITIFKNDQPTAVKIRVK